MYLEELSPKLAHVKGEKNVVTDTLSRLGREEDVSPVVGNNDSPSSDINNKSLDSCYCIFDEPELAKCLMSVMCTEPNLIEFIQKQDCFLNVTEIELDENPLNPDNIKKLQDTDEELQKSKDKHPEFDSLNT